MEHWVQFWAPQYKTDVDTLEATPVEGTKLVRWQEHVMYNEGLRQLGLVQAGEENARRRILLLSTTTTSEGSEKMEPGPSQRCTTLLLQERQQTPDRSWNLGNSG